MDDDIPQLVEELPPDFTVQALHLATVLDTTAFEPKSGENEPNLGELARKIPVTIVTGYLGSGKSTLLEMVGRTSNRRLAIILNEFGDTAAIEKAVTIRDGNDENNAVQEWLDLGNGCLCCTVKDNGVVAIENLVARSAEKIDHILLETTGVADPAPIARMFWLDAALLSSVYIDAVVTVVDLANIVECLEDIGGHWHAAGKGHEEKTDESGDSDELEVKVAKNGETKSTEIDESNAIDDEEMGQNTPAALRQQGLTTAHLQIALADCVVLNKADLVANDPNAISSLTQRIHQINASVPVHATSFGDIALEKILDLHAFEALAVSLLAPSTTDWVYHDDRIATVTLDFPFFDTPVKFAHVEAFLQQVLWEAIVHGQPVEVHRLKGILVCGDDVRVVQGVRDTYEIIENGRLPPQISQNKLVFIGKDLVRAYLETELNAYLARDS